MTVKELIAVLRQFPEDSRVIVDDDGRIFDANPRLERFHANNERHWSEGDCEGCDDHSPIETVVEL